MNPTVRRPTPRPARRPVRLGVVVAVGLALAVALAFLVAPEGSSQPDGLEKVAIDEGFIDGAEDHDLAGSPTADYGVEGVDDTRLSAGLAGALGIAVTFAVAGGLLLLVRRAKRDDGSDGHAGPSDGGHGPDGRGRPASATAPTA